MLYLKKTLLILWMIITWVVFPPIFAYLILTNYKINRYLGTFALLSILVSPFTLLLFIIILDFTGPSQSGSSTHTLEQTLNIEIENDYDVEQNNVNHHGHDYTTTVVLKLYDECLKSTVQQIEKSKFFNLKDTYCVSENIKESERDTVLYWKVRNYLEKEHLTGYWIKQNDSMYKFYTPNLSDIPNAAILFHEGYDVEANLNVKNKVLEYKYFKY